MSVWDNGMFKGEDEEEEREGDGDFTHWPQSLFILDKAVFSWSEHHKVNSYIHEAYPE